MNFTNSRQHPHESPRATESNQDNGVNATQALRDQTGVVKEDLRELGQVARHATAEKLEGAKAVANGYYEQSKAKAEQMEQSLAGYVRNRPVKSVMIAGGIGALFAMLLARR